jgi:hypothetical protein
LRTGIEIIGYTIVVIVRVTEITKSVGIKVELSRVAYQRTVVEDAGIGCLPGVAEAIVVSIGT